MPEEANLRDVTVAPNPSETPKEQEQPVVTEPKVEVNDPTLVEAAEIGRILLDSGYTKTQINELMQAPKALQSLQNLLTTDPKQFVKELANANPTAAHKLREVVAEEYVELFGDKGDKNNKDGKPNNELMQEVASLRDKVSGFETREQQRNAAAAMASTQQRYNARVDDLLGQDGVKKMGLTKSEQAGIRALLNSELASDQTAVQRVSNGNFVDVAPAMKRILENWAADKKASNEAEKQARENTLKGGNFTFPGGPQEFQIPEGAADSWDNTEEAFAKALGSAR